MLAARGAVVVSADQLAREVVEPGEEAYGAVVARFGPGVVRPDGTLDRPALARAVFADPAARADLEAITWPAVRAAMRARLAEEEGTDHVVVLDIPLLAESRGRRAGGGRGAGPCGAGRGQGPGPGEAGPDLDSAGVVVVDCPLEVAVDRLVRLRGMAEADAWARVAAQASREDRLALADLVIDNSGDRAHLEAEVERAWAWIRGLAARPAGTIG
jgi:dephospho-CoA kinase